MCCLICLVPREYAGAKKKKFKPIVISHHMLMGLKEGQEKMSKSDPDSAIFMEDSVEDVRRKIKKGYCPPQVVEKNPILDYAKYIIFGYYGFLDVTLNGVSLFLCMSTIYYFHRFIDSWIYVFVLF